MKTSDLITGNTVTKRPDGSTELANPARRVGLRQLVKAKLVSPKEALEWLLKVDPNPNHTILAWLRKKAKVEL